MKKTTLTLAMILAPAALLAQASGQAQSSTQGSVSAQGKKGSASASASGQSQTSADGKIGKGSVNGSSSSSASTDANVDVTPPREWSPSARERLTAIYNEAREKHLPLKPIVRRVSEGRAKGAAEEKVLVSAMTVKTNLSAAQDAMVSAGRDHPSDGEIQGAASAMERGVTSAQISELTRHTPSDRSLVVALDVLSKLAAKGVPVTEAVAEVQSKLDAHASDASIGALAGAAGATVGGTVGSTLGSGSASGSASGSTSGSAGSGAASASGSAAGSAGATAGKAAGAAGATASGAANAAGRGVTGTVAGTVSGTVKKP